jgi:heme exporter protein CcmD
MKWLIAAYGVTLLAVVLYLARVLPQRRAVIKELEELNRQR